MKHNIIPQNMRNWRMVGQGIGKTQRAKHMPRASITPDKLCSLTLTKMNGYIVAFFPESSCSLKAMAVQCANAFRMLHFNKHAWTQ